MAFYVMSNAITTSIAPSQLFSIIIYLQTENEGNHTQYEEAKKQIDNRQDQIVVRLDPYSLSHNCWLLSYNNLEKKYQM